jgi:hypothetical protein
MHFHDLVHPHKHINMQQFRGNEASTPILTDMKYIIYSRFNILNMLRPIVKIYLPYKPTDDVFIL